MHTLKCIMSILQNHNTGSAKLNCFYLHLCYSVKVSVACVLSDYRGLQEMTGMKGTPSFFPCFKCWVPGFLTGAGKRIFPNTYTCLPLNHPMRSAEFGLYGKHNFSAQDRDGQELPARYRTFIELMLNKEFPFSALLVEGEPSCTRNGMNSHVEVSRD